MSGSNLSINVSTRKEITTLDPNGPEIASLSKAVQVLRQRSLSNSDNPIGWLGQANIHRDKCSHATWWFLPWHRGYLYYFERVLREAAGDPALTLPYWDWTKNPQLPQAFWGAGNPLNDSTREITPNTSDDATYVGSKVIDRIYQTADFITFAGGRSTDPLEPIAYGTLEGTPHNYVHRFVGGQNGNMRDPGRAAQDPIFWLHHANVDRLWAEWTARNPGRTTTDPQWLGQSFSFFDTQGNPVSVTTSQMLDTLSLNYRYDTQSPQTGTGGGLAFMESAFRDQTPLRAEGKPEQSFISDQPLTVPVTLGDQLQARISKMALNFAEAHPTTLRLEVEGVVPPVDANVGVRVFLNLRDADASTSSEDPHYVTTFTFFEHVMNDQAAQPGEHSGHGGHSEGHMHHGPKAFYVDIGPTIQELQSAGLYSEGEPLEITLVTVPIGAVQSIPDVKIPFEKVSISAHD